MNRKLKLLFHVPIELRGSSHRALVFGSFPISFSKAGCLSLPETSMVNPERNMTHQASCARQHYLEAASQHASVR